MRRVPILAFGAALTAAASCGGDSTAPRSAPPASIEIAAGDSQTGTVGRALGQKLSVRVRDANGKAVPGATVRWSVPANDGSISPATNTTNSDGAASATWTLGPSATSTVPATATVASLTPVIFHATRHAGPVEVVNVTAPAGFVLTTAATKFTATVTDEFGNPLPLSPVSWSTSDATLATVDQTGMVTGLRLSPAVTITATSAGHSGTVTVGVVDKLLAVQTADLNMPRITVAFDTTLSATGGGGGYTWSVTSGQLPSGLVMQSNGHLSGTAATPGIYPFTATVRDVYSATASRAFTMTVCAAPVSPALGATLVVKFPDTCGVALPGIADAAYRVGVMARSVPSPLGAVLVGGGLQLRAQATGAPTVAVRVNPSESTPRNTDGVADAATWQLIQSTERVHLRLREDEIRQFGGSRSTPLQPVPARLVASAPPPPPQTRTVFVNNPAGGARIQLNVTLKRESAHVIYYQDDAAVGTVDESTDAEVQAVLDYYEQYGQSVIDDYFGGLGPAGMTSDFADGPRVANDIDGNGKFIVVQTTQAHMLSGAAAYVSSCDRFPRTGNAVGNVSTCANSNESEITYMLRPDSPYYRGVIVHETKHIASMGFARFANRGFQPSWIEEGTADIAAELSSRHASNVAERQEVRRADVFPTGVGTSPTDLSYYMYIANSRARSFLLASPLSALFADPSPNPNGSTIYGAGWLFHRYLADRYAPTYGGEAAFFRVLNLQGTGNTPIENLAGKPFSDVLSDFMAAIIAEGSAAKRSGAPERFVSYDFADIATRFSGAAWPYLQRTSTYGPSSLSLPTYFSAPNFVEFTSTPGKTLRLDILQTNGVPVTAAVDAALTIQRIR